MKTIVTSHKQQTIYINGKSCDKALVKDIAKSFLLSAQEKDNPDLRLIDQLCKIATSDNAALAKLATTVIFGRILERLCDDFSQKGCHIAAMVILRIIDYLRAIPAGSTLNSLLTDFGFSKSSALLKRFERLTKRPPITTSAKNKVRKIIILSRVTAGADIAITSVILQRLSISFPTAELVLIGPSHLADIFHDIPRLKFVLFIYKNDGTLIDKMTTWPDLLKLVSEERKGLQKGELLLFDPDTRLSQLGLLPLLEEECTFHFPSRVAGEDDHKQCDLSALTNRWLNSILNEKQHWQPAIFLNSSQNPYLFIRNRQEENSSQFIVTVNFGVGKDPRKKLPPEFEERLLAELLRIPEILVILDNGNSKEEDRRVKGHLELLRSRGIQTLQITEKDIQQQNVSLRRGIISYKGPLKGLSSLINISDCFIGYDSCGQHIANAANTPAVIAFAGAPSAKFIARWSPNRPTNTIIPVFHRTSIDKRELDILVENVLVAVKKIKNDKKPIGSKE